MFLYVYGRRIRDSALLMRKMAYGKMALSGQRHSADVAPPNDVVIEKRSSRMVVHSVIHCLPTLLFLGTCACHTR